MHSLAIAIICKIHHVPGDDGHKDKVDVKAPPGMLLDTLLPIRQMMGIESNRPRVGDLRKLKVTFLLSEGIPMEPQIQHFFTLTSRYQNTLETLTINVLGA